MVWGLSASPQRKATTQRMSYIKATQTTDDEVPANDRALGVLHDMLIENTDWSLRYLIVNTSNWWQGKEVLILSRSLQSIRWTEHLI